MIVGEVDSELESRLHEFFANATPKSMPTIIALNGKEEHNIFGSKAVETTNHEDMFRTVYEDGSTVEVDDIGKWVCFVTKEGYQRMPHQRTHDITAFVCGKIPSLDSYKSPGSGNYSDVYQFGVPSEGPYVATKVTTYVDMQRREMQLAGWKKYKPERSNQKGRIEAVDTSLVTGWRLVANLGNHGVRVPSLSSLISIQKLRPLILC